jgi:hypothetical protein
VELVTWQIHIVRHRRSFQAIKHPAQPIGAFRWDPAAITRLEEPPQPLMPEAADHRSLSFIALQL